jgi:hypothetical protein
LLTIILPVYSPLARQTTPIQTNSIVPQVWPFLLGHYLFHSTRQERQDKDRETKQLYETTMSEWLAVEAIVRQKDKETMAMNLAKLSSESTSGTDTGPQAIPTLDNNLSNDVSTIPTLVLEEVE